MKKLKIKVEPETHNDDKQQTSTMSQQDLEQSATQNKLSAMEQLDIKVEPETHNNDTPHVHNMQQDTFLISDKKLKYESMLHHEFFIKDDPDTDNKCSELIDDTQVMCASTSQSSDGVTMHIKEEPAADVGYDEPARLPLTQLMNTRLHLIGPCAGFVRLAHIMWPANPAAQQECLHCCIPVYRQIESGISIPSVSLKGELTDSVTDKKNLSMQSVHKQQVVPSGLSTDDVCVSGNSDCTRQVNVKEHAKCTASGNTYPCHVCQEHFTRNKYLKRHLLLTHNSEKPHKCNRCNKTFSNYNNLKIHKQIHAGGKPYKCNICNKCYKIKEHFISHKYMHTQNKLYTCNTCHEDFKTLEELKVHKSIHTEDSSYMCYTCDRLFLHKGAFKNHVYAHTQDKPHKCDTCLESFRSFLALQRHILTHARDKPYKCNKCYKCYKTITNLKLHMLIHTRDRLYKCNTCYKDFRRKVVFKYNKYMHTQNNHHNTCDSCSMRLK